MPIDHDAIENDLINVARDNVGSLLSTTGPTGGEYPSVIKAYQATVSPPAHPYIVLDTLTVDDANGREQWTGVDENELYFSETPYKFTFQYTVYGGNARQIAQQLKNAFKLPHVRDAIETDTTGSVEETFAVISANTIVNTEYLEVAAFNLTFNIVDTYTDTDSVGVFDTVNIDAEVKRNVGDSSQGTFSASETST